MAAETTLLRLQLLIPDKPPSEPLLTFRLFLLKVAIQAGDSNAELVMRRQS